MGTRIETVAGPILVEESRSEVKAKVREASSNDPFVVVTQRPSRGGDGFELEIRVDTIIMMRDTEEENV
jgi:hypothetical protein